MADAGEYRRLGLAFVDFEAGAQVHLEPARWIRAELDADGGAIGVLPEGSCARGRDRRVAAVRM
ncbi:MAG: hypothetical protein AMS25_10000 [Gemmatimonas sp. SM23_52]|nr:MAG: hypothetical protein AMS25_10000 [Gemmatimonas sp. SM23_52]